MNLEELSLHISFGIWEGLFFVFTLVLFMWGLPVFDLIRSRIYRSSARENTPESQALESRVFAKMFALVSSFSLLFVFFVFILSQSDLHNNSYRYMAKWSVIVFVPLFLYKAAKDYLKQQRNKQRTLRSSAYTKGVA